MLSTVSSTTAQNEAPVLGYSVNRERTTLPDFRLLGETQDDDSLPWWVLLWTAICLDGSAAAALMRCPAYAIALLAGSAAALFWWYVLDPPRQEDGQRAIPYPVVALLIALFLVPASLMLRLAMPGHVSQTAAARTQHRAGSDHILDPDAYQSVVLWPKPPRKAEVRQPRPQPPAAFTNRIAKPLVIPFTGAYWYYRDGAGAVGAHPHVAHGTPTTINFYSTDVHRLVMEAHQELATPVDIRCCREIEVSILNADTNPGSIRIGLVLMDSASRNSQSLGVRPVRSSEPPLYSMDRPPVGETLRFAIPANSTLRRFDRLKVLLLPSAERSLGGVKIAVRNFRLLPSN